MAGHHHRHPVGGAGARHRADGPGPPHAAGQLGVGPGLARGNRGERLPHLPLEGGPLQVERDDAGGSRAPHLGGHPTHQPPEPGVAGVHPGNVGRGELGAEIARQAGVGVAQQHRGHAAVGSAHEQAAVRRRHDAVSDVHAPASQFEPAGRHAQQAMRCLVHAAAGPESRLVHRSAHGAALAQLRPQPLRPSGGGIVPRRHADHPLEGPLQVPRAQARDGRELRQAHPGVGVDVEVGSRPRHRLLGRVPARVIGVAAAAGPVAGRRGLGRRGEERHVLPAGPARGAGGAAVDPRGRDGVDEATVRVTLPVADRLPGLRAPGLSSGVHGQQDKPRAEPGLSGCCGRTRTGRTSSRRPRWPAAANPRSRPAPPARRPRARRAGSAPAPWAAGPAPAAPRPWGGRSR